MFILKFQGTVWNCINSFVSDKHIFALCKGAYQIQQNMSIIYYLYVVYDQLYKWYYKNKNIQCVL